jgi:hypothetical protein
VEQSLFPSTKLWPPGLFYQLTIPIRLVNLERFPVKIKKHYLLGELHPVTHIEHFSSEELSDPTLNLTSPDIKSIYFSINIFYPNLYHKK